ncbi:L-aspartate oxidase [Seminavis robusta]|uniref:L-aspartate oxidase n=1 Tax=Seminavis robusta TaxID=568900 RepID=A0A9N8HYP1_9STRA|nr:L-aspartate oxidase [Seminavis robusta]|eukprot:Sro2975_g341350.1 L-aspartate oxidase (354) ;mRNA; f:7194-8406
MIRTLQTTVRKVVHHGRPPIGGLRVTPKPSHLMSSATFSTRIQHADEKVADASTRQQQQQQEQQQIEPALLNKIINSAHHIHDIQKADRLLVVGSGVAGCSAALVAAETYQIPVTLLFAGNVPEDCNSFWAQGGIIYRNYDPVSGDSAKLLAQDIHRAGAGLCEDDAVQKVSEEGPDRVRQLLLDESLKKVYAQVPFDKRDDGTLSLCLEASHAAPRILHRADHTGRTITQHITQAAARHPLISMQPHTIVTDLVVKDDVCLGVATLNRFSGEQTLEYACRGTVLASGGLGGIYEHSTNPAGFNALGSSVALAYRAGAKLKDLEERDLNIIIYRSCSVVSLIKGLKCLLKYEN